MIENINKTMLVTIMVYIPIIIKSNSYFNAMQYGFITRSLCALYKSKYNQDCMSRSAYYGVRKRIWYRMDI